jgi:phage shock protein A
MPNIFKRISDIVAANINDLIDRVEDPERMIKQLIREMEENICQAKEGVIEAVASEKQLGMEVESHRRQVQDWQRKAETALREGKEELARSALARKKEHERILTSLEPAWEAAMNTSANLKALLRALEAKLEEVRRKRGTLVARQRAAEAREQMGRVANHFQTGLDAHKDFTRMEDKVTEMEARAQAVAELDQDASALEREFKAMEIDSEVEAELAALKRKVQSQNDA